VITWLPDYREGKHGRCNSQNYSSSIRGHLRPANYDYDFTYVVWPGLLDNVGPEVGEGRNSSDFCNFQLSCHQDKRKAQV